MGFDMKEYLRKNSNGEYILEVTDERETQEPHAKHWIEVPKGCDYLISVFGANSFIDSDVFAKVKPKNVLWSRKPMKEYLIKINGAYKLCSLLENDVTDEYIEIPEGDTWAYKNSRGNIITMYGNVCQAFIGDLVWQRESMKEDKITKDYLEKQPDGNYVMKSGFAFKDADWIEIPEGAFSLKENFIFFNQDSSKFYSSTGEWENTPMTHLLNTLWQRESPNDKLASAEQYRQAEVLPFIDDDFADSDAWIESNVEQDNVNNPSHYADSAIECIDAMQAMLTPEQFIGYLRGNIFKYQWRYEKKNGVEDLKKSQWYLDKLISAL